MKNIHVCNDYISIKIYFALKLKEDIRDFKTYARKW